MSEHDLPDTIEELLAFIMTHRGGRMEDVGARDAASAKISALLVRDALIPSLNTFSAELAITRQELHEAAQASTQASRALFRVTVVYVIATVVYTGATLWQVYSTVMRAVPHP